LVKHFGHRVEGRHYGAGFFRHIEPEFSVKSKNDTCDQHILNKKERKSDGWGKGGEDTKWTTTFDRWKVNKC
jgi:hypothetical protein